MNIHRLTGLSSCAVLLAATLVLAGPAGAATPPPPTLTGETLAGGFQAPDGQGSTTVSSETCDPVTGATSFTYTATGVASGPYAGTYTETGSVSSQPADALGFHTPTSFQVSFTISPDPGDSSFVSVTGSKQLVANPALNDAFCFPARSGVVVLAQTSYSATITTSGGTFHDEGSNPQTYAEHQLYDGSPYDGSSESFVSSLTQTVAIAPTSKDECRDDGYALFGFRNQGQCIAYLEGQGSS